MSRAWLSYSLVLFCLYLTSFSSAQDYAAKFYSGISGPNNDTGHEVVYGPDGNIYVGALVDEPGQQDNLCLRKFSPTGATIWTKQFNGAANIYDRQVQVAVGTNRVYLAGNTRSADLNDFVVVQEYDFAGNLYGTEMWAPTPDSETRVYDLAVDKNDNAYVVGNVVMGSKLPQFLLQVPKGGGLGWVSAYWSDFDSPYLFPTELIADPSGDFVYLSGYQELSQVINDSYVMKVRTDGQQQWVRRYDYGGNEFAAGIALDTQGCLIVAGTGTIPGDNDNTLDGTLLKFDKDGNLLWEHAFDGNSAGRCFFLDVTTDAQDNIYVAGGAYTSSINRMGAFQSLSSEGIVRFTRFHSFFGNTNQDQFTRVIHDGQGFAYVAGWGYYSGQSTNGFVTRIADNGGPGDWSKPIIGNGATPPGYRSAQNMAINAEGLLAIVGTTPSAASGTDVALEAWYQKPYARPDSYETLAGVALVVAAEDGFLKNDSFLGQGITLTSEDFPAHGHVSLAVDGSFTYTPEAGYKGTDSFSYSVQKGALTSQKVFVTIQVTANGVPATLSLNPSTVTGGDPTQGTVTLTDPAPAGGAVISLSDNTSAVTTPADLTVPQGQTSGTFTATTSPVSSQVTRTVTATRLGISATANLVLKPGPPGVQSLSFSPNSIIGGNPSTGTVKLTSPAVAGGATVNLSDNSSVLFPPASVNVAASSNSGSFVMNTATVSQIYVRSVTATLNGVSKTTSVTINPGVLLISLSLNPSTVKGGQSSTGTVEVNPAAPAGSSILVQISDDSSSIVQTPSSVSIAPGSKTATFQIGTGVVSSTATRTVVATHNGVTKYAKITLTP